MPTFRDVLERILREAPSLEIDVRPCDHLEYLADLIKKLGIADKYRKLVSDIEVDVCHVNQHALYARAEALCPYNYQDLCVLQYTLLRLYTLYLERATLARVRLDYMACKLVLENFEKSSSRVVDLAAERPELATYLSSSIGTYKTVLYKLLALFNTSGHEVHVRVGDTTYRFRVVWEKVVIENTPVALVGAFHDLDRDVVIVQMRRLPECEKDVEEFCSLFIALRDAVFLKDLILPLLRQDTV